MKLSTKFRSVMVGTVLATGVVLPMALTSAPASAGPTAFCTTVFSYAKEAKTPATSTLAGYRTWAKDLIPFYEKLQSEAPNATTKKVLGEIVTVLKYYSSSSSFAKLTAYETAHRAQWEAGTKALAAAIISCAKSLG
jgi:hypothetical protein